MEEFTKEEIQEAREAIQDLILELMRDKIEYLGVKTDFFETQSIPIGELIYRMELRVEKTLKEEQEVNDKLLEGAEVKENLEGILGSLRSQQKVENHGKKDDEAATRINGFYQCLECPFKAKYSRNDLKVHKIPSRFSFTSAPSNSLSFTSCSSFNVFSTLSSIL